MNNLYILTKQEFTSLYRFGQIPLNLKKIIETVSSSKEETDAKVFEVFMSLPYFVGDEEYLIICFENKLIKEIWLEIENVSEIIPLTKAAKNSYQMKFDSKLDFGHPRFESVVKKVVEETDIQEMYRGAKAFWNLCKVKKKYEDKLSEKVIKTVYNKRMNGIKSVDFTEDFFIHLLAYDRYQFFPNTDLGFFYDVGEILAHSKGFPSLKGSGLYNYLENNKDTFAQKSFLEISEIISKSDDVLKFKEQLTVSNLRQYIVAAIFLKFKADLSERDTIQNSESSKMILEFRESKYNFTEELNFAIYLTGTFFTYKKFYDELYDLAGLKVFKKKPKSTPIKEVTNSKETPTEETPTEETPTEETPTEETPTEETPTEETPTEEAPTEEAPTEEAPTEEVPAEEAPTEEAPTGETPTEEAPTEETPTEETPTEETPTEETPTEETPTEEAPTEEAPTEEAPTEEAPAEEAKEKELISSEFKEGSTVSKSNERTEQQTDKNQVMQAILKFDYPKNNTQAKPVAEKEPVKKTSSKKAE